MNTHQQFSHTPHAAMSRHGERRNMTHIGSASLAENSADLSSVYLQQPKLSRHRSYTTPAEVRAPASRHTANTGLPVRKHGPTPPHTPDEVPSLSSSANVSPQSSKRRSPLTPTCPDHDLERHSLERTPHVKTHPSRPSKDLEKRNISYPISSQTYSDTPFALDIRVDRDAYEPHRRAPQPIGAPPPNLETSYLEWDDPNPTLERMKKGMRLVSHGRRKQTAPPAIDTHSYKSTDSYANATPRSPQSSKATLVIAGCDQRIERPRHVSNFSRPTLQERSVAEKRVKQRERDVDTGTSPHVHWQDFLKSNTPTSALQYSQKALPAPPACVGRYEDNVPRPQPAIFATRSAAKSMPAHTRANSSPTIPEQYQTRRPIQQTNPHNTHDAGSDTQGPSFYTYHVTRRIDPVHVTDPNISSYTPPYSHGATADLPIRDRSLDASRSLSQNSDDQTMSSTTKALRSFVQGISKKPSISSIRRRANHSKG